MRGSADELLPTRASLLSRLREWDDQESWQEFFSTYWKLIYGFAVKAGLEDAAARDVVQETVISVAKSIREFRYQAQSGSFKAWLLTITRRRVVDHLRRKKCRLGSCGADDEPDRATPVLERIPDPSVSWEVLWDEEWERNLLSVALEKVKQRVKPRQYQLFDCFVLKGWPMPEITTRLRVSMGQVYFAKYKITSLLQRELRELHQRRC